MRDRTGKEGESPSAVPAAPLDPDHTVFPVSPKNRAAVELGRRGGQKGGAARAARLSPEERADSARRAAAARWKKEPEDLSAPANGTSSEVPPSPFAKFPGKLDLGGEPIDCYVLDTGERVISLRAIVKSLAGIDASNLGDYIGVSALKPYINSDLVLGETRDFHIPGTQLRGRGILAERVIEILTGYVRALRAGALTTERQREIAAQCSLILGACAKVGLIALIDEATGYQYQRAEDALQIKLRAFIAEELRAWEKTFPDELWEEFGRLTNWQGALHSRPKWWGKLVTELIYDTVDPDVAKYLKDNKPAPGVKWHQQLTENYGARQLVSRCFEIIGMAKTCRSMHELREKVAQHYGHPPPQLPLYLPAPKPREGGKNLHA
jgi:P63C domain